MRRRKFVPRPQTTEAGRPFETVEDAWFWALECYCARHEGARPVAGLGDVPRPCEPQDILVALHRLHRHGRLGPVHLEVLGDFGRRLSPPDPKAPGEAAAATRWREAMRPLERVLRAKGIII